MTTVVPKGELVVTGTCEDQMCSLYLVQCEDQKGTPTLAVPEGIGERHCRETPSVEEIDQLLDDKSLLLPLKDLNNVMRCLSENDYIIWRMRVYVTGFLLAISKYFEDPEDKDLVEAINEFQMMPSALIYITKKSKQVALRFLHIWKDAIVTKGQEKNGDFLFQNGEINPTILKDVYSLGYVSFIVKSKDCEHYDIEVCGTEANEKFERDIENLCPNPRRVKYKQTWIRDE